MIMSAGIQPTYGDVCPKITNIWQSKRSTYGADVSHVLLQSINQSINQSTIQITSQSISDTHSYRQAELCQHNLHKYIKKLNMH